MSILLMSGGRVAVITREENKAFGKFELSKLYLRIGALKIFCTL